MKGICDLTFGCYGGGSGMGGERGGEVRGVRSGTKWGGENFLWGGFAKTFPLVEGSPIPAPSLGEMLYCHGTLRYLNYIFAQLI